MIKKTEEQQNRWLWKMSGWTGSAITLLLLLWGEHAKKPGCKGKITKEGVLYFILNALDNCTKWNISFSNIQNQNKNYIALF